MSFTMFPIYQQSPPMKKNWRSRLCYKGIICQWPRLVNAKKRVMAERDKPAGFHIYSFLYSMISSISQSRILHRRSRV